MKRRRTAAWYCCSAGRPGSERDQSDEFSGLRDPPGLPHGGKRAAPRLPGPAGCRTGLPCSSTAPLRTPTTSAAEPTGRASIIRAWISGGAGELRYEDFAKLQDEGICPRCGRRSISISRGIEVGNIFQLGSKYTEAMGMRYLDREGNFHFP